MALTKLILLLSIAVVVRTAASDVLEFEDKADWDVATGAKYTTIAFTEFAPGTQLLNHFAYLGANFVDGYDQIHTTESYENDGSGVAGQGYITIIFHEPMNWIAANFPGSLVFELYYGGALVYTSESFGSGGPGWFGGIVSTLPFDQVRCMRLPAFQPAVFIDDLYFGPSTVAGDLTHDAAAGPADLGELLAQWGTCVPGAPCGADLDDSGSVGPLDLAQLLAAWSEDCNDNSEFDHFEIITAGDCNDSGAPDECDIAQGLSLDCNANGIPDECELETLDPTYVLEDGESDTQVGLADLYLQYPLVWFNAFTVDKGGETIDRVLAAWGVGPATVAVWSDPNDDGIPHDAVLETVIEDVPLTFPLGGPLRTIEIPPTYVGEAGERFFVGLMLDHDAGEYPAWLDEDSTEAMASWLWIDLSLDGAVPMESEIPGTWLIRAASTFNNDADGNGIPDDCR